MITSKQTKKQEKLWYEMIARYALDNGCFPHHNFTAFQMHHAKGRKFVHNKVAVGGWFVLPIEFKYHDVSSNNPFNVTHHKKRYEIEFGKQADQFLAMCAVMREQYGDLPFDDEVLHAIGDL